MNEIKCLVPQWQIEVAKKWGEVRDSKGYWLTIHSPRWTHAEDQRRRRLTTQEVMRWTVEWFSTRGHTIECVLAADREGFGIREVKNAGVQNVGTTIS